MTLLLLLSACNNGSNNDAIGLDWSAGDTFHVSARYRTAEVKHEESPSDLDGERTTDFGESWSDEVVWTYEVVESNFTPEEGDSLGPYAEKFDGSSTSLAVVRAWLDVSLNDDPSLLEADPVVYFVFREDNDRLAGIVSFENVDGVREETAFSSTELGRSWSLLSQSQLVSAPHFIAPFGATWDDGTMRTENGGVVDTIAVDAGVTDVIFEDEMTGGLVATRYEDGQPWPTWTVSDNMESTLLSAEAVDAKRASGPYLMPEAPEDFDYRAALQASIDIESALRLTEEEMAGGWNSEVYEEFQPWAGYWWDLKKGGLVFGFDGQKTYSHQIQDQVDPIKLEMDELSSKLRDLEDGDEKDAAREEYQAKQKELVTILVDFYKGVLADLDGGKITIADGNISHTEDGWSYKLDELSPMDKYAVVQWAEGNTYNNPFFLPAWEILNSYNPGGEGWWGHCNGWAGAAILTNEPTESLTVDVKGQQVEFSVGDQKGLLSEAHYSTHSRFYGDRYYKEGDDAADLYPSAFHKIITFYLKEQRVPLVFDTTATEQVWNFPAWGANVEFTETTPAGQADLVNVNTADMDELDELPGVGPSKAAAIIEHREAHGPFQNKESLTDVRGVGNGTLDDIIDLITVKPIERTFDVSAVVNITTDGVDENHVDGDNDPKGYTETWNYTLVTDQSGLVIGQGTWEDDKNHPDFAWVPYFNSRTAGNGSSENPFMDYSDLIEILGDDVDRH
jgi:competence ComEA-like helix-hairpin-helix protein